MPGTQHSSLYRCVQMQKKGRKKRKSICHIGARPHPQLENNRLVFFFSIVLRQECPNPRNFPGRDVFFMLMEDSYNLQLALGWELITRKTKTAARPSCPASNVPLPGGVAWRESLILWPPSVSHAHLMKLHKNPWLLDFLVVNKSLRRRWCVQTPQRGFPSVSPRPLLWVHLHLTVLECYPL